MKKDQNKDIISATFSQLIYKFIIAVFPSIFCEQPSKNHLVASHQLSNHALPVKASSGKHFP